MDEQPTASCPGDETLAAMLGGVLEVTERAEVERHIDRCGACRRLVVMLARDGLKPPSGRRWGRYVEIDVLGQGAMADVVLARDTVLEREVAIKLVAGTCDARAAERLRREAQALAQLDHPNIVPVYDVGVEDGALYLAMQRVRGQTLQAWLETGPGIDAIVTAFVGAARGLAAAHAADLVHRDVKPTNIMIDETGTARVLDFGLVAVRAVPDGASTDEGSDEPPLGLTRRGTAVGTPLYMAPEQHRGEDATARSDQFSLCVALYEALYGRLPFRGETVRQLHADKERGLGEQPVHPGVGRSLRRALLRGLSPDPAARWPSLKALVDALQPRARPRAPVVLAGVAAALLTTVVLAPPPEPTCGRELAEVYDARAQRRLAAALASDPASARITARLETWVDEWDAAYGEVCEGPTERLEARTQCLNDRARDLQAMLAVADDAEPERVARLAWGLPPVGPCRTRTDPAAEVPEHLAAEVAELRAELARAKALGIAGDWSAATTQHGDIRQRAEALGYAPLVSEATYAHATAMMTEQQGPAARRELKNAFFVARRHGDDRTAARAASRLVLPAIKAGDSAEADTWIGHAEAAASRHPDPETAAAVMNALAIRAQSRARWAEALTLAHHGRLLAQLDEGPESPAAVRHLFAIADIQLGAGEMDDAIAIMEEVARVEEAALGPDHPVLGHTLGNLGLLLGEAGRPELSLQTAGRGIAILEAALGAQHLEAGRYTDVMATALSDLGRFEEALDWIERGIAIMGGHHGMDDDYVLGLRYNRASILLELSRLSEAADELSAIIVRRETELGPDHTTLGGPLGALGRVRVAQGRADDAVELHRRALRIERAAYDDQHHFVSMARTNLAESLVAAEQPELARPLLQRARAGYVATRGADTPAVREIDALLAGLPPPASP